MSDPKPNAAPAVVPPGAKGKRKKLLLIVAALVVVLGAGGAGAFFMLRPAHAAAKKTVVRAEPIYVALDPAFIVNFESNGLVRFLQVSVQVMTRETAAAELLKRHDPVIRNGMLMLLSGQKYETLSSTTGKEALRKTALAEVRKIVAAQGGKAATIEDLYFTSFVMQ